MFGAAPARLRAARQPMIQFAGEAVYRYRHMPPAPATRMLPDVYVVSLSALLSITSATRATCVLPSVVISDTLALPAVLIALT